MRWMLLVAAALLAFGCGQDDAGCKEPGGSCAEPTSDAGQLCTDSEECEGWCEAPAGAELDPEAEITGMCSGWTRTGCMSEVRNGRYGGTLCY